MKNNTAALALLVSNVLAMACGPICDQDGACEPQAETAQQAAAIVGVPNCPLFPSTDLWNRDVSADPVDPNSSALIANMGGSTGKVLRADFGSDVAYGIPWITVGGSQAKVPMSFSYASESDAGPYPFPSNVPIEGGGDRHAIVVDRDNCVLYETFNSWYSGPGWRADAGAKFNLRTGAPRPAGWTSADAAGLPIFPGLVRRDEVLSGAINHALRFTVRRTRRAYVAPARHFASSSTDVNLPPMGARVRLKASFDISRYTGASKVILTALKKYGMFVADNGSDFFLSGERNAGWSDSDLAQLRRVPATAFEVVKLGALTVR